jgi:hypothetical protein
MYWYKKWKAFRGNERGIVIVDISISHYPLRLESVYQAGIRGTEIFTVVFKASQVRIDRVIPNG